MCVNNVNIISILTFTYILLSGKCFMKVTVVKCNSLILVHKIINYLVLKLYFADKRMFILVMILI